MSKIQIQTKEELRDIINNNFINLSEKEYNLFCQTFNEKYDYSSVIDMSYLFKGCFELKSIPYLKTENVTSMSGMFYGCMKLKEVPYMDTSNVVDTSEMFLNCCALKTIPHFNTSKVTKMFLS